MPNKLDLKNKKFNFLLCIKNLKNKGEYTIWLCRCDCGKYVELRTGHIISGNTKSCGCIRRKSHHMGESKTPLGRRWQNMMKRCYRKKDIRYSCYGGRGIKVCRRWHSYSNFKKDMASKFKPELSLDRINNDGDYSPSNCRWATKTQQRNNTSLSRYFKYRGIIGTLPILIEKFNIKLPYACVYARIRNGVSIEKALQTPLFKIKG